MPDADTLRTLAGPFIVTLIVLAVAVGIHANWKD